MRDPFWLIFFFSMVCLVLAWREQDRNPRRDWLYGLAYGFSSGSSILLLWAAFTGAWL
jgi:hypothetical protein